MIQAKNISIATVRREIEASAEELFDAWLDPASLAVWMRPGGILSSTAKVDPYEGGAFEIVMHSAEGPIIHTGSYRVIDRPRRLVFTWISPATGQTETLVSVEFHAGYRTTEIVVVHEKSPPDAFYSYTKGWRDAIKLLAQKMATERTSKSATR